MRRAAILIITCLVVAACGGDVDGSDTTTTDGDRGTTTDPSPAATTTEPDGGAGGDDVGRVTVDLGEQRYEFLTSWAGVSACHLHEREESPEYPWTDYFEVTGYAIDDPAETPQLGVTPEVGVVMWHSAEEANAYIEEFTNLPVQITFHVRDEGEGLFWGAYDLGQASLLSEWSEDPSWVDDYPGLGSWTVEPNRVAGEIYLRSGGDLDEPVLASFEITCPG